MSEAFQHGLSDGKPYIIGEEDDTHIHLRVTALLLTCSPLVLPCLCPSLIPPLSLQCPTGLYVQCCMPCAMVRTVKGREGGREENDGERNRGEEGRERKQKWEFR